MRSVGVKGVAVAVFQEVVQECLPSSLVGEKLAALL